MKRMLVFGREKKQNASMEGEETKRHIVGEIF